MKHLPIFYDLSLRDCLVVGAGGIALRKVQLLIKTDARVIVVAPQACEELKKLATTGALEYIAEPFSPAMVDGKALIIATTGNTAVNQQISELARMKNIPVNVVDNPDLCSFIMPAIVDRDPVQIAISTGGTSPVLARLLRAKLETLIPYAYGRLAILADKFRPAVKQRYPEMQQKKRFWEYILQGPVAEMTFAGQETAASKALEKAIQEDTDIIDTGGEVYLVGAGPGNPDLLTFRALRLMQQAEIVLYDRLVAPEIVNLARKDAEYIYVGKKRDQHALHQSEINQLLVDFARQGKRVLRLKGGDPFIFGRGGEEIELLATENIPFQVVPGITAASGCSGFAGIPLTHRDYAHSCIFTTGHLKDGHIDLNWNALVQPKQTVVVYMGISGLTVLCQALIDHKMPPTMPAALVQQGTMPRQRVFISELQDLPNLAERHDIQPPTMIIIGEVVKLHQKLAWFEPTQ